MPKRFAIFSWFQRFIRVAMPLAIATVWSLILSIVVACGISVAPAYAHRPHDVVSAVQLSPDYSEDSTVYIIVRSNLFRSKDSGNTWTRLVNGLDNRQSLSSLVVAPSDHKVLYTSAVESGIYQSLDGGDTWQAANGNLANLDVHWLQVSPNDANILFAQVGEETLYKTEDGGANWTAVLADTPTTAIGWSPDSSILLVGDNQGHLYRSENQGTTWQDQLALPETTTIHQIDFSPNFRQDKTFWVGTSDSGIYQTIDAGKTFTTHNDGLDDLRIEDMAVQSNGRLSISTWEGGYWYWDPEQQQWIQTDKGLTRDPMADDDGVPHFESLGLSNTFETDGTVFLGGFDGLYKSTDSGNHWTPLETLSSGTIIDMAVSPTFAQDDTLAVATYVGEIYLSRDRGDTWQPINQDLYLPRFTEDLKPIVTENGDQDPRRFFDIALSTNYVNDQTLFTSILYGKILQSTNGGNDWSVVKLDKSVRGVSVAVSPSFKEDTTVFSTSQKGLIYRSQNGGGSYSRIAEGPPQRGNNSPSLVISPSFAEDSTLFSTGEQGIYRSDDSGKTWTLLTEGTALEKASDVQLALTPDFASSSTLFASSNQGLYRSQNQGNTWQTIDNEQFGSQPWVEAIALSPDYGQDQTLMISVRGKGLLISKDAGQTFSALGNPNVRIARMGNVPSAGISLQFSPNYGTDQTIYGFGSAMTDIYRSTDGGNNWEILSIPRQGSIEPSTITSIGLFWAIYGSLILKLALLAGVLVLAHLGLNFLTARQWITFTLPGVQSAPDLVTYGVPKFLKGMVIALIVVRLVFTFSGLGDKPYNADEVRGFYRFSGYQRSDIMAEVFEGEILTQPEMQSYQIPVGNDKTDWDALTSLADYPEHPPLYDMMARYWMKMWPAPYAARVLAVILGLVYLPCAYWFCIEVFHSAWAGWATMALLSISPYHILLSQGAREYSLWTILLLTSSTALLKALRVHKLSTWGLYMVTVAVGMYSHLFFAFWLLAQGLYVLLTSMKKLRSQLLPFLAASLLGCAAFGPWIWVVLSRLDVIESNTQWVQNRSSDLKTILLSMKTNIAHGFVNLGNSNPAKLSEIFILALIFIAFYCLIQNNSKKLWLLLVLPLVVTLTGLGIPDILNDGGRSLQTRYLVPALLPITLTVAFFLTNGMQRSKTLWERTIWTGAFAGVLVLGIVSSANLALNPSEDYLGQGRTASVINQELAPLINQSTQPLILSDATHSFLLALSYDIHEKVSFQAIQNLDPAAWPNTINLSTALTTYSEVFVYMPSNTLVDYLATTYGVALEPLFEDKLYRITI